MLPYTILAIMPWNSGLSMKLDVLKYPQMSGFITLTRDRDSGRVFPDPKTGQPRVAYTPSNFDRAHGLQGLVGIAKLCYVMGAAEIRPLVPGMEPFIRTKMELDESASRPGQDGLVLDPELGDARFGAWLKTIQAVGNAPPVASYISAHQMGTCRMSASPDQGVVNEKGKVWGTEGLYVADASVFPSASGVNPMATNMAIAHTIAMGIGEELRGRC